MPSRRAVLGMCVTVTGCGCLGGADREKCVVIDTVADTEPVEYITGTLGAGGTDREIAIAESTPESVTIESSLAEGELFQYEDVIYRIERVESVSVEQTKIDVTVEPAQNTAGESSVAVETLSAVDRQRLEPELSDGASETAELVYNATALEDSRFRTVDELRVTSKNQTYAVEATDRRTETVQMWRHHASIVATSETELREFIEAEYLVSFEDVSDAERDILETAIADQYRSCVDPGKEFDDAEQRLRSRLNETKTLPVRDTVYVSLDGERHLLTVDDISSDQGEW